MIKTIKKIDLQGNEVWQDVIVCNKCKKVLEPTDFVYETKWTGWHPVKMEGPWACGFGEGSNPVRHICEKCQEQVEKFLDGDADYRKASDVAEELINILLEIRNDYLYDNETRREARAILYAIQRFRELYPEAELEKKRESEGAE